MTNNIDDDYDYNYDEHAGAIDYNYNDYDDDNNEDYAGDPHEPLRKQLVSHSLQHCTASSSCLQVTIHHHDHDLYMMMATIPFAWR